MLTTTLLYNFLGPTITMTSVTLTNRASSIPYYALSTNVATSSPMPLCADDLKPPLQEWMNPYPSEPYGTKVLCPVSPKTMPDSETNSRTPFERMIPFFFSIVCVTKNSFGYRRKQPGKKQRCRFSRPPPRPNCKLDVSTTKNLQSRTTVFYAPCCDDRFHALLSA